LTIEDRPTLLRTEESRKIKGTRGNGSKYGY